MTAVAIAMITLGIATAINPLGVTIIVLLLMSNSGLRKANAFLVGSILALVGASLVAILLTVLAIKASAATAGAGGGKLISAFELAIGVSMFGLGIWTMTAGSTGTNATVSKLMKDSDTVRPWMAFGMGLMFVSYTIPFVAIGELWRAQIASPLESLILYLIYLLLSLGTILIPIVMRIARPERSAKLLNESREWLTAHGAVVTAVVFIVLGLAFGLRGGSGLFG